MHQQNGSSGGSATTSITVQLACSYLVAGAVALSMARWLDGADFPAPVVIALALACGIGAGLLVTANLPYGISLLSLALLQLAEGTVPPNLQSLRLSPWLWPLRALFRPLALAGQHMEELCKREQEAAEYREHLLRQASEAAAAQERNRLARELHDSIKQQIFSIRMSAVAAKTHLQTGGTKAQEALAAIQDSATEAQVEMQALLQQLHSSPLEQTPLAEAVQTQAQALHYRSGAEVAVEIAAFPETERCPLSMQETVFRIVQEAFANIARHARAQQVRCLLTQDGKALNVVIADDGQGFAMQSAHKGMGLTNIQERAHALDGTASIESAPGKGTTIRVQIPLLSPPEVRQQQEAQEQEAQRMVARAQGGLELHTAMSTLTLVILLITLALAVARASLHEQDLFVGILTFCLCVMLYGLILAHLAMTPVTLSRGEEDRETRSLRLQEHTGWANFLRLLLFSTWYIVIWGLRIPFTATGWRVGGSFLLAAGLHLALILWEQHQVKHAQKRYYALLPQNFLSWEITQRQREIQRRIILCLCLGAALLWTGTGLKPIMLPVMLWQWLWYYLLFSFLVLCMGIGVDRQQLHPWKLLATGKESKTGTVATGR